MWQLAGFGAHLFEVYCKQHESELVKWISYGSFSPTGAMSWTSVVCLNIEPLGTRSLWAELPDSTGYDFMLSTLFNLILNPTSHQWSVISNPHIFFKYAIPLERIRLSYWCFTISFNFHTIMRNLGSFLNFIWKCKSIVTVTNINK